MNHRHKVLLSWRTVADSGQTWTWTYPGTQFYVGHTYRIAWYAWVCNYIIIVYRRHIESLGDCPSCNSKAKAITKTKHPLPRPTFHGTPVAFSQGMLQVYKWFPMLQRFGSESNLCIVSAEKNTLPLGFDALKVGTFTCFSRVERR